jgi:Ulp1 family protease
MNLLGAPSNVYIYSSFACTKVLEDGNDGARQVNMWLKKKGVEIFRKDYLIFPLNENLHWSTAVVCNPGSLLVEAANNPCIILHMDPAKSCHDKNRAAMVIRQLLKAAAADALNEGLSAEEAEVKVPSITTVTAPAYSVKGKLIPAFQIDRPGV